MHESVGRSCRGPVRTAQLLWFRFNTVWQSLDVRPRPRSTVFLHLPCFLWLKLYLSRAWPLSEKPGLLLHVVFCKNVIAAFKLFSTVSYCLRESNWKDYIIWRVLEFSSKNKVLAFYGGKNESEFFKSFLLRKREIIVGGHIVKRI